MPGTESDRETMPAASGPAIILVRPQMAENIGMAARAMGNFGLADLRLVAPRDGWPRRTRMKKGAHQAASGAVGILEAARLYETVAEAVADLNHVWATTARERGQGKRVVGPDVAMAETAAVQGPAAIAAGSAHRHGVLFGPERTGLENDEIATADAIVTFPVNAAFASLNLAQAVLIVGYEWYRAAHGPAPAFASLPQPSPPASRASVLSFFDSLERELEAAGHFGGSDKRPVMMRNLKNILHRIGMTEQDVRTLRGVVVSLAEGRRSRSGNTQS